MACGTPVIAWKKGSVPEIMQDGRNGFVVENLEDAVQCVPKLVHIRREDCRRVFEERYRAERMATDYLRVYEGMIQAQTKQKKLA
jgi:glycosyltransferase involved in cell wall biosynthesis